jgi:Protein of unknown function (DUF3108)
MGAHRCAGLGVLLLACGQYLAAAELTPFEASYAWSWRGVTVAVSTLKLEHQDDHAKSNDAWVYSSTSDPRGLGRLYPIHPKLVSVLRVTDQGVEPLTFHADAGSEDHDADVTFDWGIGRATGSYEGTKVDMPIQPGIQDDLSVQIALMVDLLNGKTPQNLSMIDKNAVRDYRYQREGDATIDTPFGAIATVIYSSQHAGSPRITRFWCAPSKGYLPMRVEQKRIDKVEWTMEIETLSRP